MWGPLDNGINKGFGGWTVQIGAIDGTGHLTEHKVAKTYYVAVAEPGATATTIKTVAKAVPGW